MINKTYSDEIFVKDYFKIHNHYANIYGQDKTIILMQVGSFHEAYCTNDKGLDLLIIAQKLDVICTKKNGNKELSDANPRMMGFPTQVTHNFIEKLINLNFTIILIDQTTEPPNPKREITAIYSPSTYLENNKKSNNNLISIVIDKTKTKINDQLCIGISSYDLSTGNGYIFETYSTSIDHLFALDETLRFLEIVKPREVLLINKIKEPIVNLKPEEILQYLHIDENITYKMTIENQEKVKYQQTVLESVFENTNINIFETLDLAFYNLSRLSLVVLLEYCKAHQQNLLNKLKKPINFTSDKFLYYGNRAMEQLNVFNTEKGLFDIINYTKSPLGNRFLQYSLTKPLIDKNELEIRYEAIQLLHKHDLSNFLEDVYDIERLHRRIDIENLHPYELNHLFLSFYQIEKLLNYLKSNKLDVLHNNDFEILNKEIQLFITFIEKHFILEKLDSTNFRNYFEDTTTFLKKGLNKEIDELVLKVETGTNFIKLLTEKLEKLIEDDSSLLRNKNLGLINEKYNDRDGHYMLITNRRCKILKEKLNKLTVIKVGSYELKVSDLTFTELPRSANTKINCKKIKEISNQLLVHSKELANANKNIFKTMLKDISNKFSKLFIYWSREIGYLDFINSGAICAIKNKYSKPIIQSNENSFFTTTKLRHPIVEYINKEYNYVAHDITLGTPDQVGILLYGINSSGKSTLMKSIGLNIILAQIGYFVAADSFTFNPYKSLFTRIIGNDNIYRGLSSFMIETMELTAILKRNTQNTLVIADEICRGTEEISANIIVAYMLEALSSKNCSFITASHLHRVANLDSVKKLKNVKVKHLKITYDDKNDQLIYDRHLSDGQGTAFYGLMVSQFVMKDASFNKRTAELLIEYNGNDEIKKSHYNDEFMIECYICKSKKNLESHHIIPQKDFIKNELKSMKKDNTSNIITLCSLCHDKVDTNELVINSWLETSNGRHLDYKLQPKVKAVRTNPEIIEYIKGMKNTDIKLIIIKIKEKFQKRISTKTIEKYLV